MARIIDRPRPPGRSGALRGTAPGNPRAPRTPPAGPDRPARSGARHAPAGYVALVALIAFLAVIGLVMVLSASSVPSQRAYGSPWVFFVRQVIYVAAGVIALVACVRLDYRVWRRAGAPLLVASVVLMTAVLVPGVGVSVNGSARWLGVGIARFQPSELAKLAMILFAADLLTRRADRMHDVRETFRPVAVAFGVMGLLVMAQPDMGTTLVIAAITLSILFVAGAPMRTIGTSLVVAAAGALVLGIAEPYRRDRLLSFLHPTRDAANTGYQAMQSYIGLGSGGLIGRGLGNGVAKWGYLPNPYTDFIFAAIGEETGLLGTVVVVSLFVAFAVLGVRAAVRAPDRFGTLLAAGVTAWIVVQALLNMGAVIGILPVTGVPLPFVSYGGSSVVITMGAAGILANVARQGR